MSQECPACGQLERGQHDTDCPRIMSMVERVESEQTELDWDYHNAGCPEGSDKGTYICTCSKHPGGIPTPSGRGECISAYTSERYDGFTRATEISAVADFKNLIGHGVPEREAWESARRKHTRCAQADDAA